MYFIMQNSRSLKKAFDKHLIVLLSRVISTIYLLGEEWPGMLCKEARQLLVKFSRVP